LMKSNYFILFSVDSLYCFNLHFEGRIVMQ